jgi:hypothetical protein
VINAPKFTLAALVAALAAPAAFAASPTSVWQFLGSTIALYGAGPISDQGETCINEKLQLLIRQMQTERLQVAEELNINHPTVLALMDGVSVKVVAVVGGRTEYWLPVKPNAKSVIVRRNGMKHDGMSSPDRTPMPDLSNCAAMAGK